MNPQVAYNIAAAVERKLGQFINVQGTSEVWAFIADEEQRSYAILRNTDAPAINIAQNVADMFKRAPPKPRRKTEDE